jgi:creatinine amidohydrolase
MSVHVWADETRDGLARLLPDAVVVLPIGATEQHGPHLPTRTDALVVERVAARAAHAASDEHGIDVVLAPTLPFGASDHHLRYGGTLSLGPATLLAVLDDLIGSIETDGGRRLLIVNGHGGNRGAMRAAAAAADARETITVAALDYWDTTPGVAPGHAGAVETSFVLALERDLVVDPLPARAEPPVLPPISAGTYHGGWVWDSIDGFTDSPAGADADRGADELDRIVAGLANVIRDLSKMPGGLTA